MTVASQTARVENQQTYTDQYVVERKEVLPREYLRELAGSDFEILDRIAKCESGWRNVPNYLYGGEDSIYTAYGPFQILKSTAKRYSDQDRRDPLVNVEVAVKLYRAEGTKPWNPSRGCWN